MTVWFREQYDLALPLSREPRCGTQHVGFPTKAGQRRHRRPAETVTFALRAGEPERRHERRLALAGILGRRLAEILRGRLDVEDIVGDLEGCAQCFAISDERRS